MFRQIKNIDLVQFSMPKKIVGRSVVKQWKQDTRMTPPVIKFI